MANPKKFKVRLRTPAGIFYSTPRPMSHGLPQGGILSPALWNLAFDIIRPKLEETRAADPEISRDMQKLTGTQ